MVGAASRGNRYKVEKRCLTPVIVSVAPESQTAASGLTWVTIYVGIVGLGGVKGKYSREFVNSGKVSSLNSDFVTKVVDGLADGRGNSSNGLGSVLDAWTVAGAKGEHETG